MLNSPAADLEIVDGNIRDRQLPDSHLEVAVVVRQNIGRNGKRMEISATFEAIGTSVDSETGQGTVYPSFVYATQIAEVEVDTETGEVVILRMVAAHDAGTIINPMLLEGQIAGGIAQGIGMALTEEVKLREGRTLNPGLMDYTLPTTLDVPEIQYCHVQTTDDAGPYGAKCVGASGSEQRRPPSCQCPPSRWCTAVGLERSPFGSNNASASFRAAGASEPRRPLAAPGSSRPRRLGPQS